MKLALTNTTVPNLLTNQKICGLFVTDRQTDAAHSFAR